MKKSSKKITKSVKKVSRVTFPKFERGISKTVLLVVALVVLTAVGGGMYILNKGVSVGPLAKVVLNPNCKYNDPELCKFMNNWLVQREYSTTTTSTFGGMTMESLTEMSGENKFHVVSKQNGKEQSNMISIDDTTYTLDYKDNKWWKMTYKPDDTNIPDIETTDTFKFDEESEASEDKTTYKFIVKESCGDLMCFKYEIVSPEGLDGKQFLWFDDREYLIRKMRMESKEGNSDSVYSYGRVTISAPSPVKEGTPSDSYDSGMSEEEAARIMKQYQQTAGDSRETSDVEIPVDSYESDY